MSVFTAFSERADPPPPIDLLEDDSPTSKGLFYKVTRELEAAVDVAMGLGRPLLVAGEPGCGKTQLGYAVARRLGLNQVYYFAVKSTSEATDLFYTYDSVRRFRDVQLAVARDRAVTTLNLTTMAAMLGSTELRSTGAADVGTSVAARREVGEVYDYVTYRALGRAIIDSHAAENPSIQTLLKGRSDYRNGRPKRRSVVVIDEIDKAPRDFCNDLLREIEDFSFRVAELDDGATPPGEAIDPDFRPIVIITSNEESQLPDAFLRRCIFHTIEFPQDEVLTEAVLNTLKARIERTNAGHPGGGAPPAQPLRLPPPADIERLIRVFRAIRNENPQKRPGIAELLDAGLLLTDPRDEPPKQRFARMKHALVKLKGDHETFGRVIDTEFSRSQTAAVPG